MADAAAEKPTHEEMIAQMHRAGFTPPQAPQAQPELTHDQMIAQMQSAGFTPQSADGGFDRASAEKQLGIVRDASGNVDFENSRTGLPDVRGRQLPTNAEDAQAGVNNLPLAAGMAAGMATGGLGLAAASGVVGAGAAAGSAIKDAVTNWAFGGEKSPGEIAKDAAKEGAIAGAANVAGGLLAKGAGYVGKKLAENVIPATVLEKYRTASDAVMKLWNSNDGDIAAAADELKSGMQQSLDGFRKQMNEQIKTTLADSTERINPEAILKRLEDAKAKLHGDLPGTDAYKSQLDEWITSVRKMRDENGMIFAQDAHALKQQLQDAATAAYRNAGESQAGSAIANELKQVGAIARKEINAAVPAVAEANNKLASLHFVEDRMNKSLIRTGAAESGLIAAGKGAEGSPRNARALKLLGEITGKDFLGGAETLAAAKTFGGATPLSALKNTGIGAGVGGALGYGVGEVADPEHASTYALGGAALGGAVTSPYAIKQAMDLSRVAPAGIRAPIQQTLGQSVMHGTGAADALRKIGQ